MGLRAGIFILWALGFGNVVQAAGLPPAVEKAILSAKSADDFFQQLEPELSRQDAAPARDLLGQNLYAPWGKTEKINANTYRLRIGGEKFLLKFEGEHGQKFRVNDKAFEIKSDENLKTSFERIFQESQTQKTSSLPIWSDLLLPRAHAVVPLALLGMGIASVVGVGSGAYWALSNSCDEMSKLWRNSEPALKKLIEMVRACRAKAGERLAPQIRRAEQRVQSSANNPAAAERARTELETLRTNAGRCNVTKAEREEESYTGANDAASEKYWEIIGVLEAPVARNMGRICTRQLENLRKRRDDFKQHAEILGMDFHKSSESQLQNDNTGRM